MATNSEQGIVVQHLRQWVGVLVRNNVAILGSWVPSFVPQEVDRDADPVKTGSESPPL